MMEQDDGHVIVDVRRQDEYDAGHIPGAILIPNEEIRDTQPAELLDLDQIILIYCRSGNRSKQAAQKLADMGYTNIYEFGGINTWTGEIVTGESENAETEEAGLESSGTSARSAETAVLTFDSFDGGGHEYTVEIANPSVIGYTSKRDYGSAKYEEEDASTNTVTITSIEDFVVACKNASKNLGAFDQLDGGQGENTLFGYGDGNGAHFDAYLAEILNDLGSSYASGYESDLAKKDSVGNTVDYRVNMYTPLYYLLESYEGYQTSTVAKYWRIRTGIFQGDCSLSTEMNLALALQNYSGVDSVDFETIWGAGHTQAERTGNSTENFIAWVNECMGNH